jgi:hypothetical protein
MFTYSDAWFLTSLILNNKWSSLDQVIATGDAINHAIFTKSEVNTALSVLIYLDYIEMDNFKQMRATNKALKLWKPSFPRAGLFSQTDKILNQLNKSGDYKNISTTEYFSDHDIDQSFKKYKDNVKKG